MSEKKEKSKSTPIGSLWQRPRRPLQQSGQVGAESRLLKFESMCLYHSRQKGIWGLPTKTNLLSQAFLTHLSSAFSLSNCLSGIPFCWSPRPFSGFATSWWGAFVYRTCRFYRTRPKPGSSGQDTVLWYIWDRWAKWSFFVTNRQTDKQTSLTGGSNRPFRCLDFKIPWTTHFYL